MRHVSLTHRVALDWLFDRINPDPGGRRECHLSVSLSVSVCCVCLCLSVSVVPVVFGANAMKVNVW